MTQPKLSKRKGISEATLAASARSGDATQLFAHLEKLGWDEDRPQELISLIRRSGPLMHVRANASAESRRDDLLASIRAELAKRAPDSLKDFDAAQVLLLRAEEGYRRILASRARLSVAAWSGERVASALITIAERRLAEVTKRLGAAIKLGGLTVPGRVNIGDPGGPPVDPDSALNMIVTNLSGALIMEAYARNWFDDQGIVQLPALVAPSEEDLEEGGKDEALGGIWLRWAFMEETARYLDGTIITGFPADFPNEFPGGFTRVLFGPCEQDEYDFIANERYRDRSGLVTYDLMTIAEGDARFVGIEGTVPLPPQGFVSQDELTQGHLLSQRLGFDIVEDLSRPGGLRLLQWVRGYSALSAWTKAHKGSSGVLSATGGEISGLLTRVGFTPLEAQTFTKALSFGRRSRDLFDTPLICVGTGWAVVAPALAHADAAKIVPSVLASQKVQITGKGDAHNERVLELLRANGLDARAIKRKFEAEYDYDVLVPWGDYLFLFECKNYGLSNGEPKEVLHFRQELVSAIGQVERLVSGLREHPEIISDTWGKDVVSKELVPCVLFNEPYARDGDIDGVYVFDFSALSRFFQSEAFHINRDHRLPDGTVARVQADALRLWAGKTPTAEDLLIQLKAPFQLQLMQAQIGRLSVAFPLDDTTAAISERLIRNQITEDEILKALGTEPAAVRAQHEIGEARVAALKASMTEGEKTQSGQNSE